VQSIVCHLQYLIGDSSDVHRESGTPEAVVMRVRSASSSGPGGMGPAVPCGTVGVCGPGVDVGPKGVGDPRGPTAGGKVREEPGMAGWDREPAPEAEAEAWLNDLWLVWPSVPQTSQWRSKALRLSVG
jgi:hypothetical protein